MCAGAETRDSIEHYPFCPLVQLVATTLFRLPHASAFGDRHQFLKEVFLLGENIDRETLVTRVLFIHTLYCLQNHARRFGPLNRDTILDMARTFLYSSSASCDGCRRVAGGLLGPFGPMPPAFRTRTLPAVGRRRARGLPPPAHVAVG